MTTGIAPRRPILVTILGVIGIIQGIVTLIVGIGLIAERNDQDLLDHVDLGSDALLSTGLAALILGALTLLLAIGLLRGAEWARLFGSEKAEAFFEGR
jgi:hypothetical protein